VGIRNDHPASDNRDARRLVGQATADTDRSATTTGSTTAAPGRASSRPRCLPAAPTRRWSSNPAVGAPIADPLGPIVARFQGTHADGNGAPDASRSGPWRAAIGTTVGTANGQDSCNIDAPHFVRIDLLFPAANRPIVQGFRVYWR